MRAALAAALALAASGCAANLQYADRWTLESEPKRFVNLKVVDARPDDQGGKSPGTVGRVNGAAFNEAEDGRPVEVIRNVLVDALEGAGVEARATAPQELVAKLSRLWVDEATKDATAEVELQLLETDGSTAWTEKLEVREEAPFGSPGEAIKVLNRALARLADETRAKVAARFADAAAPQ